MLQKFFTNSIESKFIKALLHNTPLPNLPLAVEGDLLIDGCKYIYKTNIIRCIRGGILSGEFSQVLTADEDVFVNNSLILNSGSHPAKYIVISPFNFGEYVPQITEKYLSRHNYYDSETHYFLGQYLRCLRDIYGTDLMPFYNCFNYKLVYDFYISDSVQFGYVRGSTNDYKMIAVPIKFDKKYTIAIDSDSPVYMKSVFYGSLGLLDVKVDGYSGIMTDCMYEDNSKYITIKNETSFVQPFVYTISSDSHTSAISSKQMKEHEKYLYLIIQLPINNTSSVVVLEGDYTFRGDSKIFNVANIDDIKPSELNNLLISPLKLLQFNDRSIYAFSDRLVEYLLLNVIDNIDTIPQNVERVQKYIGLLYHDGQTSGVWNNYLRYRLYELYKNNKSTTKLDINGYVDNNVEKLITKGWDV